MSATIRDWIQFGVTIGLAGWAVYSSFLAHRHAKELHRMRTRLDQSLGLLVRARDTAVAMQRAEAYILRCRQMGQESPVHERMVASSEFSAAFAELRGLAFAIGDHELLMLVNKLGHSDPGHVTLNLDPSELWEMESRGQFQHIHTRIAELLKQETDQRA